jgi:hypothetical protein
VQSQLVVIVESRQRTTDGSDLQGAADISAERGHGHMFIGAGLAAVSRSRAARHPERHAVSQCQAAPADTHRNLSSPMQKLDPIDSIRLRAMRDLCTRARTNRTA